MKAVRFHAFGGPERLVMEDVPEPEPAAGEVLVRVEAAGVNPVDAKIVAGQFPAAMPPRTLGMDFAGVVVRGAGFEPGARVVGSGGGFGIARDGAYAEYVCAPAASVAARPESLDARRAAGVGVVFITAWMAVVDGGAAKPGESIVVHGAGGGVGQAVVQIASRVAGARVIAVASSAAGVARARSLGARDVIDRKREDVAVEVHRLTDGRGADVVVDVVGGAVFESSLPMLAPYGRLVAVGVSAGERRRVGFDLAEFYRGNKRILGVNSATLTPDERGRILRAVLERVARGEVYAPAVEAFPLADAARAHARLLSPDGAHGKLVLTV